ALRVSYGGTGIPLTDVTVDVLKDGKVVQTLEQDPDSEQTDALINLADIMPLLKPGDYLVRAEGTLPGGETIYSVEQPLRVLGVTTTKQDYTKLNFTYSGGPGSGAVFVGSGGTHTLNLGVSPSAVADIDGLTLSAFRAKYVEPLRAGAVPPPI